VLISKFRENFKLIGPACQQPTTAHDACPGQLACMHVATPWWLCHRMPPRTRRCQPLTTATCALALSFRRSSRRSTPRLYSHVLSITILHRHHRAPHILISSYDRAAPRCRTLPPTVAALSCLKPPGLPLVCHRAIPESSYP
jgi:hypothetical protein